MNTCAKSGKSWGRLALQEREEDDRRTALQRRERFARKLSLIRQHLYKGDLVNSRSNVPWGAGTGPEKGREGDLEEKTTP